MGSNWHEPHLRILKAKLPPGFKGPRPVDRKGLRMTWDEFMRRAEAAALKRAARKPQKRKSEAPGFFTGYWGPPPPDRRCVFHYRDGNQCKHWTVRGADRCNKHGGIRQVPEHPGTSRRMLDGSIPAIALKRQAAVTLWTDIDPKVRREVREALRAAGWIRRPPARLWLEACVIWMADDGMAWRRFLADCQPGRDKAEAGAAYQTRANSTAAPLSRVSDTSGAAG